MDLKLTGDDMDLTDGELSFVRSKEAIAQDIDMSTSTWLGESVYNTTAGIPYTQVIFVGKNPDLNTVKFILEQRVLSRPGVINVEITPTLDSATRVLTATGKADTIEGEIDFSEIIPANP